MRNSGEAIKGIALLSELSDVPEVRQFVERAFDTNYLSGPMRQVQARRREYGLVWEKLKKPATTDINTEVLAELKHNEDETVIVGINEGDSVRNFRLSLEKKRAGKKFLLPQISMRLIAEKDPFSEDDAGILIGIRVKRV